MNKIFLSLSLLLTTSVWACHGETFNYNGLELSSVDISVETKMTDPVGRPVIASFQAIKGLKFSVQDSRVGSNSWVEVYAQDHTESGQVYSTTYALKNQGVYPGAKVELEKLVIVSRHPNVKGCGEVKELYPSQLGK